MLMLHFITGSAGTGKTYSLIEETKHFVKSEPLSSHQKILFLSRMHGSRRRLIERLGSEPPDFPFEVSTVDALALTILNRWRQSYGYQRPIHPGSDTDRFRKDDFGFAASFSQILLKATELLSQKAVADCVSCTYPLIVIDEFQDCIGDQLAFVRALRQNHALLLAGDAFQSLDSNECAVDWVLDLARADDATVTPLDKEHRFQSNDILEAARALRSNTPLVSDSPLVVVKPTFQIAVYETMFSKGTTLLSPTKRSLDTFMKNLAIQRQKKNRSVQRWDRITSDRNVSDELTQALTSNASTKTNRSMVDYLKPLAERMIDRQSSYRGIPRTDRALIEHCATSIVHQSRAYSRPSRSRQAMTIHTAKNQEFIDVHIVWHIKGLPSKHYPSDKKRRILYNAITRATTKCKLIVMGTEKEARADPVLSLLLPAHSK